LHNTDPRGYLCRGRARLALGQAEAATKDLRTALFLGDSDSQYYLGQLALREGDARSAIALYRQSIPPSPGLLLTNLGYDFLFYRQGGIYESNLLPINTVPPSGSQARRYLELVDLYAEQGEIESARQLCQELLVLSPGYQPAVKKLQSLGH
jgi:tetratricopeptide (TPR) repeat protein